MPDDKPPPSTDPPPPQAAIDDTATLYSILVPAGTESYVRLGAPDGKPEGRLPPDPAKPGQPGHDTSSPYDPGILLYATGTIEQAARQLVTHTTDKLELRGSDFGLSAAYWSTAGAGGFLAQASVQRGDFGAVTVGAIQDTVVGSQTDIVLGQSAQLSMGLRLTANSGNALNLSSGQVVNLVPGFAQVQGKRNYSSASNQSIVVGETLQITVAATEAAKIIAADEKLAARFNKLVAFIAAAVAAEALVVSILPWEGSDSMDRETATMKLMKTSAAISDSIAGVLVIIDVLGLLLAQRLKASHARTHSATGDAGIKINSNGVSLRSATSNISVTNDGIEVNSGGYRITLDEDVEIELAAAEYADQAVIKGLRIDESGVLVASAKTTVNPSSRGGGGGDGDGDKGKGKGKEKIRVKPDEKGANDQ